MAVLRAADSGLKDYELKDAYENSHLTVLRPDVALSNDSVGSSSSTSAAHAQGHQVHGPLQLLRTPQSPGRNRRDAEVICERELDILGLFEEGRISGSRDVSVIMAYDVESMEPVCSTVFPGNLNYASVFRDFLETNRITRGVIVTD